MKSDFNLNKFFHFHWAGVGAVDFHEDALAWFDRMSVQPTDANKVFYNTFFVSVNDFYGLTNLSDKFDVLQVPLTHDRQSARLNLVKDAHNIGEINTPGFTPFLGYDGNGTDMALTMNYNAATQGVNYLLNDCAMGCFVGTDVDANAGYDMGVFNVGSRFSYVNARNTAGNCEGTINTAGSGNVNIAVADPIGLSSLVRSASNDMDLWKDDTKVVDDTDASTGIPNADIEVMKANNNAGHQPRNYICQYAGGAIDPKGLYDAIVQLKIDLAP